MNPYLPPSKDPLPDEEVEPKLERHPVREVLAAIFMLAGATAVVVTGYSFLTVNQFRLTSVGEGPALGGPLIGTVVSTLLLWAAFRFNRPPK
jgi:hypothetical protein